jgi:predicted N-formylglutamate amidohydrolase
MLDAIAHRGLTHRAALAPRQAWRREALSSLTASDRLLDPDEPAPVLEYDRDGRSSFVITVDHAGARIPRRLRNLGLPASELAQHTAWDIGALAVAQGVAAAVGAALVAQNYSRLVIDCNRDPSVPSSICTLAEHTEIPGNVGLSEDEVWRRRIEVFNPYHDHIRALLDERVRARRRTILVAQHSMTPVLKGVRREMHASVTYNRDRRFAGALLDILRSEGGLVIGDNEPYKMSDETGYSLRNHAELRGLPHVQIEIRQDLILDECGQREWARRLASALNAAEDTLVR